MAACLLDGGCSEELTYTFYVSHTLSVLSNKSVREQLRGRLLIGV